MGCGGQVRKHAVLALRVSRQIKKGKKCLKTASSHCMKIHMDIYLDIYLEIYLDTVGYQRSLWIQRI